MTDHDDENFLGRWSRRKHAGGAAPVVTPTPTETATEAPATVAPRRGPPLPHAARRPADVAPPVDAAADEAAPPADDAAAELPDIAKLPDIDSLTKGSDYTGFMRDGVPDKVRRLALRKLWASDPVFNYTDGMAEYDEDYSQMFTGANIENVKSSFRVGKGFATDEEIALKQAKRDIEDGAAEDATSAAGSAEGLEADDAADDDAESPAEAVPETADSGAEVGNPDSADEDPDAKT